MLPWSSSPIVKRVYELQFNVIDAVCVWHLEKNMKKEFKTNFEGRIFAAAKPKTVVEYQKAMNSKQGRKMDRIQLESIHMLIFLESDPSSWSTVHFHNPQFSIITSNSAESMNSTFEELHHGSYFNTFVMFVA